MEDIPLKLIVNGNFVVTFNPEKMVNAIFFIFALSVCDALFKYSFNP